MPNNIGDNNLVTNDDEFKGVTKFSDRYHFV